MKFKKQFACNSQFLLKEFQNSQLFKKFELLIQVLKKNENAKN